MQIHKNYVEIIGNLGDAPELKMSNQGQPRLTFDVCTSEAYKEGEEWKSRSTWLKCVAWGNIATTLDRMKFAKGERVQLEGKIRNNNWINSQNGEHHNDVYIQVSEMRKMAKPAKSSDNSTEKSANGNSGNKSFSQTTQKMFEEQQASAQIPKDEDDLPF
ncbi:MULTISPECIES: single-stranded DNA-binding protein [unclassified Fibrobacter]|uniref:single-stranded DNA-binding protein n=1 Tax=unclassified Fibrobacter TaxID=2634177 RepID=UPI00091CF14D|nr:MULTISPECIES: single-stranded DNA-binding protein [unclassified Fibrobacter]SHL29073.1 single-strand binding protein [Fibrobacter sp. UWH6]